MTEVQKLTKRVEHAQNSMYKSLGADLTEASKRMAIPGNPRIDDDTAIYNDVITQLVRLNIDEFNSIIDSDAVRDAVDTISSGAASLKKEAKLVRTIANDLSKWQSRIGQATDIVGKIANLS